MSNSKQDGVHLVSDTAASKPAPTSTPAAPKKLSPAQQAVSFAIGGIAGIVGTTCVSIVDILPNLNCFFILYRFNHSIS